MSLNLTDVHATGTQLYDVTLL